MHDATAGYLEIPIVGELKVVTNQFRYSLAKSVKVVYESTAPSIAVSIYPAATSAGITSSTGSRSINAMHAFARDSWLM